jgi:hypothetical protein
MHEPINRPITTGALFCSVVSFNRASERVIGCGYVDYHFMWCVCQSKIEVEVEHANENENYNE